MALLSLGCFPVALLSGSLTDNLSIEGFNFKVGVLKVATVLHAGRLELFLTGCSLVDF